MEKKLREKFDKKIRRAVQFEQPFFCEGVCAKIVQDAISEALNIADVVKSLPNDEEVKAHIDTLPYYGTCTTEYNEGFKDGVKWFKEQLTK